MPTGSRWLVRAALLQLLLGATLGALLLVPSWRHVLRGDATSAHADIMLIGWMLQLACGIAAWIFPREADVPVDQRPFLLAAILLNAGVLCAASGALIDRGALLAAGRVVELAALALIAFVLVPRIRPPRMVPGTISGGAAE